MMIEENKVIDSLKMINHPESGKNIIELGLVKDLFIEGNNVNFSILTTAKKDPFLKSLLKACERTLKFYIGEEINVNIETKTEEIETKKINTPSKPLSQVKNIIGVASGKGGVGKSTVAANLAISLAKTGAKVGLLDADIWGPSVPNMFDLVGAKPIATQENGKTWIQPLEKYGIKLLSVGFFVDPDKALIWRGSMATSALVQFINEGNWGELDYIVIDMPPGTGDIHLTLVQTIGITGVVIVSTPQEVALADARKGVAMFKQKDINVPVLGIVENMAYFTPAELPNNKYFLFGKEGAKKLANELNVPLLAQIPIVQGIMEGGDKGQPIALMDKDPMGIAFKDLAGNVIKQTDIRNKELAPTEKVKMKDGAGCSTN